MIGKMFTWAAPAPQSAHSTAALSEPSAPAPARMALKKAPHLRPLLQAGKAGAPADRPLHLDVRPGSYFKQMVDEQERALAPINGSDLGDDGSNTLRPPVPREPAIPQNGYVDFIAFAKHAQRLDSGYEGPGTGDKDAVAWLRARMPKFGALYDELDATRYVKLRNDVGAQQSGAPPKVEQLLQATMLAYAAADATLRQGAKQLMQQMNGEPIEALAVTDEEVTLPVAQAKRLNPFSRPEDVEETSYKLHDDPVMQRELRHALGTPNIPRVRFMWGEFGLFYVSSTVIKGGFGKFRVARHRDGTLFGVKEFRTPKAVERSPDKAAAKTGISELKSIFDEIKLIQKLAPKVSIYGHMFWQGNFYLMMTPFKGDMVSAIFGLRHNPTAAGSAARLGLRNVAADLSIMHKKGYVHRDVKWENVLFDMQGQPLLWDFGMAKKMNLIGLLRTNEFGGTFFPPETLWRDEGGKFHWYETSDVFCLGAMVCELFRDIGTNPFQAEWYHDKYGNLRLLSMGGEPRGYDTYRVWHSRVNDGADTLERLGQQIREEEYRNGKVGRFFGEMLRQDFNLTILAVYAMLDPDPNHRMSAAEIRDLFDTKLAGQDVLEQGAQALRDVPQDPRQKKAISAVDYVFRKHHADVPLTTAA